MPKVFVDDDWMEPLWTFSEYQLADEIELSEEEIEDFKNVTVRFCEWQKEIKRRVDASREARS